MSLHKFAEQVAAHGRGDDSLLVHMTPDEVQRLQAFAEANGTTMTINPETGLPEAGFLSDLFKAVAPIALGAFLGPGAFGIAGLGMGATTAGLVTGGLTTLATGSLSRGLMAGLGAYGGAGLAEGLMGAGVGAAQQSAMGSLSADQIAAEMANTELTKQGVLNQAAADATKSAMANTGQAVSSGFNAVTATPSAMGAFAKQNLGNIAAAAAPIMAGAMVPTTTKLPTGTNENYIRQFDFNINPETGKPDPLYGVRTMAPVKANEWKDKTFQGQRDLFRQQNPNPYALGVGSLNQPPQQQMGMAGGGIVALAGGGDAALAAYQAGDYGKASQLLAEAGMGAQDVVSKYGLSQADAATVAQNLGYKGDMSGIQYATPAAPAYTQYSDEQIGSYLANPVNKDIDIGKAIKATNADPAAVNRYIASLTSPFIGSTDTTGGSGTFGIYDRMVREGVDPNEYYKAAIANDPKYGGWSQQDIQRGYQLDKSALLLSKSLEGTVADPKLGYDKYWAKFMDDNGYTVDEMAQAFGISKNDVQRRYDDAKKITPVVPPITTTTKTTDTGGVNDIVLPSTPSTYAPPGTKNPYGNVNNPGDLTFNPDGTTTVTPNIPGRPYGGFIGIQQLKDAYTKGGGSLGYTSKAPKTIDEFNQLYNTQTGDSLAAYNYLMGKGANPIKSGAPKISMPYAEYALGKKTVGLKPTIGGSTVKGVSGAPQSYFDEKAYLAANPDVEAEMKAGKSNFASAYEHWLRYGQKEGRKFTGDYDSYLSAAEAEAARIAQQADAGGGGGAAAGGLQRSFAMGGTARDGMQQINAGTDTVSQAINTATSALGGVSGGGGSFGFDGVFGSGGNGGNYAAAGSGGGGGIGSLGLTGNTGGFSGKNNTVGGFGSAGGYQGQGSQNSIQQSGMPDFLNQMQGFDAQIQKLPSVTAYNDYTNPFGGRQPTANEMAQIEQLRKGVLSDPGYLGLQSQAENLGNKYQQQANPYASPYNSTNMPDVVKQFNTLLGNGNFTSDAPLPEGMMGTAGGIGYDPNTGRMDLGSAGGSGQYSLNQQGLDESNMGAIGSLTQQQNAAARASYANTNPASMSDLAKRLGMATGGMTGYAVGGGLGSLGSYSDGGRLLKGPGDGVSDSIPATIGRKQQPARLADGEFVIPARIVSELGNGSTDAGAKKLYAMMDRVQRARGKTTGKNKVAANSRSDKYLPA